MGIKTTEVSLHTCLVEAPGKGVSKRAFVKWIINYINMKYAYLTSVSIVRLTGKQTNNQRHGFTSIILLLLQLFRKTIK